MIAPETLARQRRDLEHRPEPPARKPRQHYSRPKRRRLPRAKPETIERARVKLARKGIYVGAR